MPQVQSNQCGLQPLRDAFRAFRLKSGLFPQPVKPCPFKANTCIVSSCGGSKEPPFPERSSGNVNNSATKHTLTTAKGKAAEKITQVVDFFGCPPGIRTPICRSRGGCPTIERGGSKRKFRDLSCSHIGLDRGRAPSTKSQLVHHKGIPPYGQTRLNAISPKP